MYFVKLDVRACFDTIDQAKLLQIMRDALSDVGSAFLDLLPRFLSSRKDEYTVRRFSAIGTDAGKYKKRWLKKAFSSGLGWQTCPLRSLIHP